MKQRSSVRNTGWQRAGTAVDAADRGAAAAAGGNQERTILFRVILELFLEKRTLSIFVILRSPPKAGVSKDDSHRPGRTSFEARPAVQVHRQARTPHDKAATLWP